MKEGLKILKELREKFFECQLHEEPKRRARNQFKRDYTRIIYSSSFRRLQGKMQLLGVKSDKFYRNRLTHSLEVAQIARAIAEKVGYKTPELYVVEAGALAHDFGNPPFGHCGEEVLDSLAKKFGGFEGNAQTFRILTRVEKKNPDSRGLNLSLRTLLSTVKYFKKRKKRNTQKFLYDEDFDFLKSIVDEKGIQIRTLDAQIIDLADEIAYAAHDLEDALSLKLFNVDELQYEFKISKEFEEGLDPLNQCIEEAKKFAQESSIFDSSEEYSFLLGKELTSLIVNKLIEDIGFVKVNKSKEEKTGTIQKKELDFKRLAHLSKGLKKITFKNINRTDYIQAYERMGEKILRGLFEVFSDEKFNKENYFLPVEYRPFGRNKEKERKIIDYLSGMMDSFAINSYKKYFGENSLNKLY